MHLLEQHRGFIEARLSSRCGPKVLQCTTMDDLYNEVVELALRNADAFVFVDHASFRGWVSVIATRVIARELRARQRAPDTLRITRGDSTRTGIPESQIGGGGRTPSSAAACTERQFAIRDAIKSLSARYALVIRLYKLEERSLADVAERLGLTKNATTQLLRRALAALRARFSDA